MKKLYYDARPTKDSHVDCHKIENEKQL